MTLDNLIKEINARQTSWDDLREQRNFNRIQEKRKQADEQRSRLVFRGSVAGAVLGAAALFAVIFYQPDGGGLIVQKLKDQADTGTAILATNSDANAEATLKNSVLTLPETGRVALHNGAEVTILSQSSDRFVLEQVSGQADYEITPNSGHQVTILAVGIEITVVGTVFNVSINDRMVHVKVVRGVVEVDDGKRAVLLKASEAISVMPASDKDSDVAKSTHTQREKRIASRKPVDELFREVDQARSEKDLLRAASLLNEIIDRRAGKWNTAGAQFMLGKVEQERGRYRMAAKAFHQCFEQSLSSSLNEDALAEEALSWAAAKQNEKARFAAKAYLRNYPSGLYSVKMKKIAQ